MAPPLPLDVPKKKPYPALPAPTLLDVIQAMCARGFLRQATRLAVTSRTVAAACPMGTGRQIYDAAEEGNTAALTTYLAYWRGNRESDEVLNWDVDHICMTPLAVAADNNRVACVDLLAAASPAVDVNRGRVPALCVASRKGFAAVVRILVAVPGILVNTTDEIRSTPLHMAAKGGHAEVVRILVGVKGIRLTAMNGGGETAPSLAIEGKHHEVIVILEEAVAAKKVLDDAGRAIIGAARHRDMAKLRPLVQSWSGNEDVLNWDNAGTGFFPLLIASWHGHADAVQILVDSPGVDANKVTSGGFSAIIGAAYFGRLNVLRVLLAVPGIDLNKRATCEVYKGKTALGIAMTRDAEQSDEAWARKQECAVLLRAAGAHDEGDFESDNDDDENDDEGDFESDNDDDENDEEEE